MDTKELIARLRGDPDAVDCEDLYMAADAIEAAEKSAYGYKRIIRALQKENLRLIELLDAAKKDLKTALFADDVTSCTFCSHANPDKKAAPYCLGNFCDSEDGGEDEWEWRGVPDEN